MDLWEASHPFYVVKQEGGQLYYLSGWSQSRLQPTYVPSMDGALIWINEPKFNRWQAQHSSFGPSEWEDECLAYVPVPEGRDRGGDRFRRDNRNRNFKNRK